MDLREGVAVSRVTIHNCNILERLSNSVVSLVNYKGNTLKAFRIGNATDVPLFDINFVGDSGVLFDPNLVWRVRVQLEGTIFLHMSEVQVYDTSGVNRALNNPATQSSTYTGHNWGPDPASKAVNGVLNDFSCTNDDAGMYHE